MQPRQVAAHARVIEARRRERPLRVALAALRRQRVVVDVVLPVAIDAEIAAARERPVIAMAALARDVVVRALEREVADIVEGLDVLPRARAVALLAARAVLALVNRGLGMAAEARGRSRPERDGRVAVRAPDSQVLAVEVERRHRVVVEQVVARLEVTLLALLAEPALVGVVIRMATLVRAVARRVLELACLGMTRLARVVLVLALELEPGLAIRVLSNVVLELQRVPRARRVTRRALLPELALVQ